MNLIKQSKIALLTAFVLLFIALLPARTVSAHTPASIEKTSQKPDQISVIKIKIKIIIIIIRKKKGVVEIGGMRMAGNTKSLENNEVLAEAYVDGGKFFIQPLKGEVAKSQFILSDGFKVSKEVGLKLGEKGGFSLKAGKIDFTTTNLGNFEIQD